MDTRRWLTLTADEAAAMYVHAFRLSQPPRVMPPIVPGDARFLAGLAENPHDKAAMDQLHRRLFGG